MTEVGEHKASSLKNELIERGYAYSEWQLGEQLFRRFQAPNGWMWITRKSFYDYPFISTAVRLISKDKNLSNAVALRNSISVPETIVTSDIKIAENFLAHHHKVIVKPIDRGASEGLSTDITDTRTLAAALQRAKFDDKDPLVQRQVDGDEVRFTVVNGTVVSAVMRQTPRLIGDGIQSLKELFATENEYRKSLIFPTLTYPQLSNDVLTKVGLPHTHVLSDGEVLELSRSVLLRDGGSFIGVLNQIHPSYTAIAELMARDLNPAFLVVDLIIGTIEEPANDNNYVFLEFNTAPSTGIYSSIRSGDSPDVIQMLADLIVEHSGTMKS